MKKIPTRFKPYYPDHDTIADFRKTHLKALAGLFVDVLRLCQKAGLASLGHIALDGTKVKANASKHKAMSYGRMEKTIQQLEVEVKQLLEEAQTVDEDEDARYGKGKRIDEIPEELQRRQKRLAKIKEARGFRRFSLRGLDNVTCEWDIVCLTHNILKVFRSGFLVQVV